MARGDARVVIAEPWSVLRRGIIGLLAGVHTVVDHFDDPEELRIVAANRPVEVAVVGDAPGLDLPALVRDVCEVPEPPAIVVLVDDLGVDRLRDILQAGARAVLTKRVADSELLSAISRVLAGDRVIDQQYLPLLFGGGALDADAGAADSILTRRERDVLRHLAKGCSNRQIAQELMVGESTVKTHLVRIYAKLQVDDRHHAVGRALELGLLV